MHDQAKELQAKGAPKECFIVLFSTATAVNYDMDQKVWTGNDEDLDWREME